MSTESVKPSGWFYLLALFVAIGGIVGAGLFLGIRVMAVALAPIEVKAPGKTDLDLTKLGTFLILGVPYQSEGEASVDKNALSELHCTLHHQQTGAEIKLESAAMNAYGNMGQQPGVLMLQFELAAPGMYELSADYPEGKSGPEVNLLVMPNYMNQLAIPVLGALAIAAGSLITSLVLMIIIFVRRRQSRARISYQTG